MLEKDKETKKAEKTILKPKGTSKTFNYPTKLDIPTVPYVDI